MYVICIVLLVTARVEEFEITALSLLADLAYTGRCCRSHHQIAAHCGAWS